MGGGRRSDNWPTLPPSTPRPLLPSPILAAHCKRLALALSSIKFNFEEGDASCVPPCDQSSLDGRVFPAYQTVLISDGSDTFFLACAIKFALLDYSIL
jgi:hypothetical protein